MGRTLKTNVNVRNRWYGPAHDNADKVPDDVAEQITNPAAWGEKTQEKAETPAGSPESVSASPVPAEGAEKRRRPRSS